MQPGGGKGKEHEDEIAEGVPTRNTTLVWRNANDSGRPRRWQIGEYYDSVVKEKHAACSRRFAYVFITFPRSSDGRACVRRDRAAARDNTAVQCNGHVIGRRYRRLPRHGPRGDRRRPGETGKFIWTGKKKISAGAQGIRAYVCVNRRVRYEHCIISHNMFLNARTSKR